MTGRLWPSGQAGSLDNALSVLRSIFGAGVFPPHAQRITFDPQLVACDALELLEAEKDPVTHPGAVFLYRAPFLDRLKLDEVSTLFRDWVVEKRRELEEVFFRLCETECRRVAEEGRWEYVEEVATHASNQVAPWEYAAYWLNKARQERAVAQNGLAKAEADQPGVVEQDTSPPAEDVDSQEVEPASDQPPSLSFQVPGENLTGPPPREPASAATPARLRWRTLGVVMLATVAVAAYLLLVGDDGSGSVPQASRLPVSESTAPLCAPGAAEAVLVSEIYGYGARIRPGTTFTKGWTLQNVGACTWPTDLRLTFAGSLSDTLSVSQAPIPLARPVAPGQTYSFDVPMRAPGAPAEYEERWQLTDARATAARIRGTREFTARIFVPQANYPVCAPGQARASLVVSRLGDNMVVIPGRRLTWSWTIRNTGNCTWDATTRLVHVSHGSNGRLTTADVAPSPPTPIGLREMFTFVVPARGARAAGVYREEWELREGDKQSVPVDGGGVHLTVRVPEDTTQQITAPLCGPGQARLGFLTEQYPDDTVLPAGYRFLKQWTVVNEGTCTPDPRSRLVYASNTGEQLALSRDSIVLGEVLPAFATYTFEVPMRAPSVPGVYREDWRIVDPSGATIRISKAGTLWAKIVVPPQ